MPVRERNDNVTKWCGSRSIEGPCVVGKSRDGFRWLIRDESCLVPGSTWKDDMTGLRLEGGQQELEIIRRASQEKFSTFLDVGANVGYFTIRVADAFEQVIAVEPNRSIAEVLRSNLVLNDINNAAVYECAIFSRDGLSKIFLRGASSQLVDLGDPKSPYPHLHRIKRIQAVCLRTLDTVLSAIEPSVSIFAKLDAEGAELEILKGAEKTLRRRSMWLIELHEHVYDGLRDRRELIANRMRQHGHRIVMTLRDNEPLDQEMLFSNC